MANEKKHTLITLSLAGAIGYYLYNKLMKFNGIATSDRTESAHDRTMRELQEAIQEDFIPAEPEFIEEPQENIFDEEYTAPVDEYVFQEEAVDEDAENLNAFDDYEADAENTADVEDTAEEVVEEPVEELVNPDVVFCEECGSENNKGDRFCQTCGAVMASMEIEELDPTPIAPPVLEFSEMNFDTNVEMESPIEPEEVNIPAVEDDIEDDIDMEGFDENAQDTDVEDLFSAMEEEPKVMENVEPLHKVDAKDSGAKQEYKSIMDFFNTL